jgi:sterol desaturase/sphingolipid hydroxylase (fatty acid hydroxylase superfamily)
MSLFDGIWAALTGFFSWEWLAVASGLSAAAVAIEAFAVGWQESSLRRLLRPSGSARHDWAWFLFSASGLGGALMIVMTLGLSFAIGNAASRWVGLNLVTQIGFWPLQLAILLVMRSFLFYWTHRISHIVPALWELHKYHHSATEMTVVTVYRAHPLDSALYAIANSFPFALVGADIWGIAAINYISMLNVSLQHSNVMWTYGRIGRWIWMSPYSHRIHHSDQPEHYNRNFSTELAIWDRLFGTYYEGDVSAKVIGVDGSDDNSLGVLQALWVVQVRSATATVRSFRRRSVPV